MKNQKYMKLSEYAKNHNIHIRTAWQHFMDNKIVGAFKTNTNRIYIPIDNNVVNLNNKVIIYTRISSNENKDNLNSQAERLTNYATVKGYQVVDIIKDNHKNTYVVIEKDFDFEKL